MVRIPDADTSGIASTKQIAIDLVPRRNGASTALYDDAIRQTLKGAN